MEKPYRFYLMHKVTKEIKPFVHYRSVPLLEDVQDWVKVDDKVSVKQVVFDVIEDTRYEAKLRLWKYINKVSYQPYKGTEIGKSIPILR